MKTQKYKVMNDITQKQNEPISIARLKAQRRLYRCAKKISFISFILFVVLVVIGNMLKFCLGEYDFFMNILSIYAVSASVLELAFSRWAKRKKKMAATIQQLFDAYVYNMQWKKEWGDEPTHEFVCLNARKESEVKLEDWYEPLIEKASHNVGVLLCQMENVRYEERLKEIFYVCVHIVFWVYAVTNLLLGLFYFQESFMIMLQKTILPIAPIILCYITIVYDRQEEVEQRSKLEIALRDAWTTVKGRHTVAMSKLENIQTILLAYRCAVNTVPDWFYKMHRNILEDIAYQSTKDRLVELNVIK